MLEPSNNSELPAIPGKRYFTIGEVSDLCGVKPHVLRYWEQEFPQLKPVKRRGNRRYYQRQDVIIIRQIRSLLERYLDLQPHEGSNLSIMLYNCDAAGLPFAAVNALGSVHDEDEMHCNVLVRHRDRPKLNRIYRELLEGSEADPDALVVTIIETKEGFKIFKAFLRICQGCRYATIGGRG